MIYKRGKFYWYRFKFRGKLCRGTTRILIGRGVPGEESPKEKAKQVEAGKRTRLALGEVGIVKKDPAQVFSEFVKRFEKWVAVDRAGKPKTVAFYKDRIRQLLTFDRLKNLPVDAIDERLIADYVQWRGGRTRKYAMRKKKGVELADTKQLVSVGCINRDLATLRRVLNIARLWKVIPTVPVIHLLPGEKNHERVLSHREEDRYLAACPELLRQFATVMLDTGMRPEEVCRISWDNVRLDPVNGARYGYIHNPRGKTKWAKRNLSLTARMHGLLEMRWDAAGKPKEGWVFPGGAKAGHIAYSSINSQHDRTIRKLNLPQPDGQPGKGTIARFRIYDLRHTFLTRLGEANADPFSIQKIAGHASILVSQRYVHPTPERIENAFTRLEDYNAVKIEQVRKELDREKELSTAGATIN